MNQKKRQFVAASLLAITSCIVATQSAQALKPKQYPDSFNIPERAIMVTGDKAKAGDLVAILYDRSEMHFSDPGAPRFLLLDREGKLAFGIGGYLKGTVQYDFAGAIDDNGAGFVVNKIPTPNIPSQRSGLDGSLSHSTLAFTLVGRSKLFGYYKMFMQTQFSGNGNSGYGLKLKQAYLTAGYVTVGLANSTWVDAAAGTPVIDDQGPAGENSRKNVLVRYAPRFSDHLSAALGLEIPSVSYQTDAAVGQIKQRVPDIPAYVQYAWNGGASHVRFTGMVRAMSYRDLLTGHNRFTPGWAVQLSGVANATTGLKLYWQGAYGHGYGQYVKDFGNMGLDLAYSATAPGKMKAPRLCNFEVGASYQVSNPLSFSAVYSQARTLGDGYLGHEQYRMGQYVSVNGYYNFSREFQVGLSYLHGRRTDYSGTHGTANRIEAMVQYNF